MKNLFIRFIKDNKLSKLSDINNQKSIYYICINDSYIDLPNINNLSLIQLLEINIFDKNDIKIIYNKLIDFLKDNILKLSDEKYLLIETNDDNLNYLQNYIKNIIL